MGHQEKTSTTDASGYIKNLWKPRKWFLCI